ncbi:MAG: ROK family protein [Firmicutes bacterium]|nr:ROK family protein [Bacillota bacterium]MDD4336541.1 ROK family protein [Bacillota bacterium]MDD4791719.1 ROK family protein [Bacillota bacterium]
MNNGVNPHTGYFIGVDLGGTKIDSVLVNQHNVPLDNVEMLTCPEEGQDAVMERIIASINKLAAGLPGEIDDVKAIGVGSPGPLNKEKGTVVDAPNLKWKNVPVTSVVRAATGLPVYLENDANVAALAENRMGAGRGTKNMVYVTVSTGIGSGLILDGKLYSGITGAAGELGHVTMVPDGPMCGCGNRGCLESLASGTAIARRAKEAASRAAGDGILMAAEGKIENIDAVLVSSCAEAGDPMAVAILRNAFEYLGIAVANLVNLLNVEMVVIGGGVSNIGDVLFDTVRRVVGLRAFHFMAKDVEIVPAALGVDAGMLGAACYAMERWSEEDYA